MTKTEILAALQTANQAPFQPQRASGCGRAYCVLSIPKKLEDGSRNPERPKMLKAIEAACKELGLMYLKEAYGVTGPAIYLGYDNCDGKALARSEAFSKALKEQGIPCYADAVSD